MQAKQDFHISLCSYKVSTASAMGTTAPRFNTPWDFQLQYLVLAGMRVTKVAGLGQTCPRTCLVPCVSLPPLPAHIHQIFTNGRRSQYSDRQSDTTSQLHVAFAGRNVLRSCAFL